MRTAASTPTMDRYDGCADFDQRLLENAFAPSLDAELDTHLARCGRCRRARDLYLTTADALSVALSSDRAQSASVTRLPIVAASPVVSTSDAHPRAPSARKHWKVLAYALTAASILIAAAWLAHVGSIRKANLSIVSLGGDARIEFDEAHHAMLRQGTADFEIQDGEASVDTPLGRVRAKDAKFRITTSLSKESPEMNRNQAAILVTVLVTSGVAWWSAKDEEDVRIGAGETLIRPEPDRTASAIVARSGIGVATEPGAISDSRRAAAAADVPVGFHIDGRVLDAATDAPLPGCNIRFAVRWDGRAPLAAHGRSDESGSFAISVVELASEDASIALLPSGLPSLTIEHEGYAAYRNSSPAKGGTLPSIDSRTSFSVGDVRLQRGTRITGRVTAEDGTPVAGAALLLADATVGFAQPLCFAHSVGTTDAQGRMIITEAVPPLPKAAKLNYTLTAISPRGVGWTSFSILDASSAERDVAIELGPQAELDLFVQDPEGHPLADADVKVVPNFLPFAEPYFPAEPERELGRDATVLSIFTARTDANGQARFPRLPMDKNSTVYAVSASHGKRSSAAAAKWTPDERRLELVLRLAPHAGRAVSGRVLDVHGQPLSGAHVKVLGQRDRVAESDTEGRYRIADLDFTKPSLSIQALVDGLPAIVRVIAVSAESDIENLDLICTPAIPIEGLVVDQFGVPVTGAEVGIHQKTDVGGAPRSLGKRVTGTDGRFAFADATVGEWRVSVQPPEPVVAWRPLSQAADPTVHGGDRHVELVLRRIPGALTSLIADVVDAVTLEPLEPLAAALHPALPEGRSSWFAPALERQRGRVTAKEVPAGDWTLWVFVPGHASAFVDFKAGDQAEVRLTVPVGRTGKIAGHVLFPKDRHESGLTLMARLQVRSDRPGLSNGGEWDGGGKGWCSIPLPNDGSFELAPLVPGRWTLRFAGQDLINEVAVDVGSGASVELEIPALIGGHVIVRARAAAPNGRAEIELVRPEAGFEPTGCYTFARAGYPKECTLTVLPDVEYRWTARFYDAADKVEDTGQVALPQSGTVRVKSGETVEIEVPFVPK